MAVVDTRFNSETTTYIGWREVVPKDALSYQYNVSLNGAPVTIGNKNPASTVDMTDKPLLDAYRILYNGKVIYNIYNLLRGNDDWDPMGMKDAVISAERESGKNYSMLPVQLLIMPARDKYEATPTTTQLFNPAGRITIETNKNDLRLTAHVYRFSVCELKGETINWNVSPDQQSLVKLEVSEDGSECKVIPANNNDETIEVKVMASTPSGLQAAYVLNVAPPKLDPPRFINPPALSKPKNGRISVAYKLDMKFEDQSLITWYRCTDVLGGNPGEVAVSRLNKPLYDYELSAGDIGYFIMVSVAPKHLRCDAGTPVTFVSGRKISAKDVKADKNLLQTNFLNVPTKNQPEVIPGFWTMAAGSGTANDRMTSGGEQRDAWYYGEGTDGAAGQIGLLQGRTGRLLYTPVGKDYGDMKLSMTVVPTKTAGQGFSVAHLYMDILIKFDTKSMSGYALRFIRTTKYGDAVDCMFVKYENGKVTEITKPVTTSCYRPSCNIILEVRGNKIIAHADTPAEYYKAPGRPEVLPEVNIETEITPVKSGGFGIEFNGGAASLIREMKVEWKRDPRPGTRQEI